MHDTLTRLRRDAGQLTIAALIQEREAAAAEIERLLQTIERLSARGREAHQSAAKVTSTRATSGAAPTQVTLLRLTDLCKMLGISRSTIYKWVSDGAFPRPLRISERAVRWPMDDVARWRSALER